MQLDSAFSVRSSVAIALLVGLWILTACQRQPLAVASGEVQYSGAEAPDAAPTPPGHLLADLSATINVSEIKVCDSTAADLKFVGVSLEALKAQGEGGDPAALAEFGRRHETGTGTTVDYRMAAEWYHRAADKQDIRAIVRLGLMYLHGRGVRIDVHQSAMWFRMAADKNHPLAMAHLGEMYQQGIGVDRDLQTAARWLRKAAEQGEPDAICGIAGLLECGLVGVQDADDAGRLRSKAKECMQSAAATGNLRAMRWLAEWALANEANRPGVDEAQGWLLRASELGDALAMTRLAELIANDSANLQKQAEAIAWCTKAAEQLEPSALLLLADFHERGYGVPRSVSRAFELRRQSAERGDIRGMRLCAEMLLGGRGVTAEVDKALRWYQLAAGLGDGPSLAQVGRCFKEGKGYDKSDAMAVAYFIRGAAQNDPESLFQLAVCRETGFGVPKDLRGAAQGYQRSAGLGHREAMFRLAELLRRDDNGLQAVVTDAVRWYELAALKGHPAAAERLAQMYALGEGVELSERQAAAWKARAEAALVRAAVDGGTSAFRETATQWGTLTSADGSRVVTVEGDRLSLKLNGVSGRGKSGQDDSPREPSMGLQDPTAPRILRNVSRDFTAEVTLPGPWRWEGPAAEAGVTTSPPGVASLLLWYDEKNYARLGRVGALQADGIQYACDFLIVKDATQVFRASKALPDAAVRLRLERSGNRLRASMTQNGGKSWTTFRSQVIDWPAASKVGISAVNNSAKPLIAEFREFVLVSKK